MPLNLTIAGNGAQDIGPPSVSFGNKAPPRVLLTAESSKFDQDIIRNFRAEGYQISYIPYEGDRKAFAHHIIHVGDNLGMSERFAIVAYGRAATAVLEICMKPISKLTCLVAYYPTAFPKTQTAYPPTLKNVTHLAGDQKLGQPKNLRSYQYPAARAGFAESSSETYDNVSANLSWTRTLALIRQGFNISADLEGIWEKQLAAKYITKDADAVLDNMVEEPYVNHFPTMTGGLGQDDLGRFYEEFFLEDSPPSMKMRLISRTLGTDRVADEMHLSFKHTHEIPWMLPDVEPTDKTVEIAIVSIVTIRGQKIASEHVYWDQASVLAQVGLIDSSKLPVVGRQSAKAMLNESEPDNALLSDW